VSPAPTASIVIPTRARPDYLNVTLASVAPQAARAGAEILVVSDGHDPAAASLADRHGAGFVGLAAPAGLNAARNAAVGATSGEVIVFVDDDVEVAPRWLEAILEGVRSSPDRDVFGGPIAPRLEGGGPRACGREPPPITTLDFGAQSRDVPFVWGANMAIRRSAFERVGGFDETISGRGDEEEWLRRYAAGGGRVRYLADAALTHRRTAADSSLRSLSRAAYALGKTARRNDVRKATAPSLSGELRTLAGCAWHVLRRQCAIGIVLAAHTAGRLHEALSERLQ
jgi:GT2 family glycosyltransferase